MRKCLIGCFLLCVLAFFQVSCSRSFEIPDEGSYYCEELKLMLCFEDNSARCEDKGAQLFFEIDHGARFFLFEANAVDNDLVFCGDFEYDGIYVVIVDDRGKEYLFIPRLE